MELKIIPPPARLSMYSYVGDMQGCGHIRIVFPHILLNQIRFNGYNFYTQYSSYFINDPRFYRAFTITQFQRAATKKHLDLINHYLANVRRQTKTPMIYEIDDLLIGIPNWNFASEYYQANASSIEKIMEKVDGITTSTERLKEEYLKYNQKIEVIPNHLCKFLWGDIVPKHERQPRETRPRILYQGSENHFCTPDLAKKGHKGGDFGVGLIDYIRKTTEKYQWVIMGGRPLELVDLIKEGKIEYHEWRGIFEYPRYIKSLDVDIGIAPLEKNEFNRSKSNIKNLEYVALGIPAVYTNIDPYSHTSLCVDVDDEMIAGIERLVSSIDFRKFTFEQDYDRVKEQLFWEENDNLKKYIESYLKLFGKRLK